MTESEADRRGIRLTREERKGLRIAELQLCTAARRAFLRDRATDAVESIETAYRTQLANGMAVSLDRLRKNLSSHLLTIECIDAIDATEVTA